MVITMAVTDKKHPALNDICTLIGETMGSDAIGNQIPLETETEVFCGELAITEKEFYAAAQTGIRPETALVINSMDYAGQGKVSFGGVVYHVLRRYPRVDELTELYLQRK